MGIQKDMTDFNKTAQKKKKNFEAKSVALIQTFQQNVIMARQTHIKNSNEEERMLLTKLNKYKADLVKYDESTSNKFAQIGAAIEAQKAAHMGKKSILQRTQSESAEQKKMLGD